MNDDQLADQDAWSQLLRPGDAKRWFVTDELPPLEPDARGFSPADAWWLAELSRLVYLDDGRAPLLAPVGLREVAFESCKGTQFLVVACEEPAATICVFRGSDDARDWWNDLRAIPVEWPEGGVVHQGFASALDDARAALERALADVHGPLLIGGHSLGGALALLAASRWRPVACYAFGSPRVGDEAFGATLDRVRVFRSVHGEDAVTSVPPSTRAFRATHAGELVSLPRVAGRSAATDPPIAVLDHAPVRYVEALRRRLTPRGRSTS